MQLAVPIVEESRVVLSITPKANARARLERSEPPPETLSPPVPRMANQESETTMLRQQLLETHGRAGMLSGHIAHLMCMLQERRMADVASINERAILLQEAQVQEITLSYQMSRMGRAWQHLSTDATLSEIQRRE